MTLLQLTHFEELMHWEDHPAYPCSVFVRVRFTGQLQQSKVKAAIDAILQRHPLLQAKIERRGRRWFWVPSKDQPNLVWTEVDDSLSDNLPHATNIDLREEIGLRLFVLSGTQASDLIFQFHHSCCDGAGFLAFLHDWLCFYSQQCGAQPDEWKAAKIDPQLLVDRAKYGLTWWKLLKLLPRQLVGLQGVAQFLGRSPQPLLPHVAYPKELKPPANYPTVVTHTFSTDETIRLRQLAQIQNVTTNDLLARNLFLAIFRWRREQGQEVPDAWLRMMVPVDMRNAADREMPATNIVSSVFLDRRSKDAKEPEKLLASIHEEMQLIKRNQLGFTFLFSLGLFDWLPGGIRKSVKTDRCTISFIFTNVGKLFVRSPLPRHEGKLIAGDVIFEGMQALVPLRPYNCAAFCAHQYAGRLAMDLHYDSGVLTSDQARRILELFAEQSSSFDNSTTPLKEIPEPIR